jgi:mRNA interferase MazF
MVKYIPDRGDVIWLDFDLQKGKEIQKRRPALVLSLKNYNGKIGLALVVPLTSKIKGYPFEVIFSDSKMGLGSVLADQIRSLDWKERHAEKITNFKDSVVEDVLAKVRVLLD